MCCVKAVGKGKVHFLMTLTIKCKKWLQPEFYIVHRCSVACATTCIGGLRTDTYLITA